MNNTIYIAGPMRGKPDLGRAAFQHAERYLGEQLGWRVLNPAVLPTDLQQKSYMPICLAMLREADAIGLLPGWENSAGANLEKQYAEQTGKRIIILEDEYGYTGNETI